MTQPNQPFARVLQQAAAGSAPANVPAEPSEALPQILQKRPSSAKRNRQWDAGHPTKSYRGIPEAVDAAIRDLAAELNVNKGEVARALFEYALRAYEQGELTLQPQFRTGRMTLYKG